MQIFTSWPTWPDAEPDLATALDPAALARTATAYSAAERWHGDQLRPTGVPYVEHLLEALEALVAGAGVTDPDLTAAVLLHDTVEDTAATIGDIEREFGDRVAELVDWVTKPPATGPGRTAKRAAKSAYLRRLRDAPAEAILVKLADRVSNVQRLDQMPPDFQRRYYAETITYIIPLSAGVPFFERWYEEWRRTWRHLG
jgi:(p)ppGpp synthase/HD superfamily hydrolase